MRDRLIELIDDYIHTVDVNHWYSEELDEGLADHLLDNGVIVPPCKVGDTVYIHWSLTKACAKKVYPVKVYALRWDNKAKDRRICVEGEFNIDVYGGSYTSHYRATFYWDKVGKTLFLTRGDAEMALHPESDIDIITNLNDRM